MRKFTSVLAAAGFAMLPLASQAASSSSIPTLGDVLKASGIEANGYIDFGSTWNNRGINGVSGIGGLGSPFAVTGLIGARDLAFRLNQIGLSVNTKMTENFSGTLDLLAGADAKNVPGDSIIGGAVNDVVFKQAYITYANGGLTVMGGRFATLAGSEVINSSQNQNATRSLLFTEFQPLTHTGVRASYSINKMVSVTLGYSNTATPFVVIPVGPGIPLITNTTDTDKQKTLEAQVAVTPFDGFTNALTFYRGADELSGNATDAQPFLLDLVSSMQITKALSAGLNYDFAYTPQFGTDGRSHGLALYSRFQLCNNLALGGRAEFVETSADGFDRATQYEYTLTTDYAVAKNFSVLTDVRYDKTSSSQATSILGPTLVNPTGVTGLTSITVKGIYRF